MTALNKYSDMPEEVDVLSKDVVDSIFKVHHNLGAGYLERIYEECLCIEFEKRRISFTRQYPVAMNYEGVRLITDFRLDLVVEDKIILELKAIDKIHPVHEAQIYSYLKMTGMPMGFLVNFNVPLIKDGIKRFVPKNFASSKLRVNERS